MGVRRGSRLFPADASAAGRARTGRPVRSCAGFRSSGAAAAYAGMHDAQHLGDHHRLRLTRGDRPACRCAARYRPVDGGGFLDAGNRAHPQDVLRPVRHDTNDAARGERAGERVSAASQRHGLRPDRRLRRCGELFGHVCQAPRLLREHGVIVFTDMRLAFEGDEANGGVPNPADRSDKAVVMRQLLDMRSGRRPFRILSDSRPAPACSSPSSARRRSG